jgi:GT2 family glycosyltransferase
VSGAALFRIAVSGTPTALNAALAEAKGRFLLLTDDDCEPQPGWIEAMTAPFENAKIGCVFVRCRCGAT